MSIDPVQLGIVTPPLKAGEPEPAKLRPAAAHPDPPKAEVQVKMPEPRQFQVNASFGQANVIIYRILDKATGDLVQQIPPEQLLQIARSIQEMLQAEQSRPSLDVRS
jgi:FlaG protein